MGVAQGQETSQGGSEVCHQLTERDRWTKDSMARSSSGNRSGKVDVEGELSHSRIFPCRPTAALNSLLINKSTGPLGLIALGLDGHLLFSPRLIL